MSQIQGLPPLPNCFAGLIQVQRTVSENSQGDIKEGISHSLNVPDQNSDNCRDSTSDLTEDDDLQIESERTTDTENTPFSKLNNALLRLKTEMVSIASRSIL